MKFKIEQIAIAPRAAMIPRAIALLTDLGADEWVRDLVVARGEVGGGKATNVASLQFNYQLGREDGKPLEFEMLAYEAGPNWIDDELPTVSHLGMHCSAEDVVAVSRVMARHGCRVVQSVNTLSHTNAAIAGLRWYTYVIYGTREILGVDLKFIVRREGPPA